MSEKATINNCRDLNQTLNLFENPHWLPKLHSTSFFPQGLFTLTGVKVHAWMYNSIILHMHFLSSLFWIIIMNNNKKTQKTKNDLLNNYITFSLHLLEWWNYSTEQIPFKRSTTLYLFNVIWFLKNNLGLM